MKRVTNIAEDKMLCHLDRVVGEHKPITADVFLTNYCNNKCPYCTYRRWELDSGSYAMKFEDFVQYAERLRSLGVLGMIFSGGGEPTLCPDFGRITAWMEEQQFHYGINTNFNNLVLFRPDYLKVSLDAWDEDSYESIRGVRKYGRVLDNIRSYVEWKKENSPDTTVGVQCLARSTENVSRFYEANRHLDVDYFSFRPVESTAGKFYGSEGNEGQKVIELIQNLAASDSRVVLNFKWNLLKRREKDCTAQWAQIAMNEHGEVMYCCHKPYQIVGHVMDPDIMEKKAKAGTDMAMCDIPCRMTAPNMFVSQVQCERKDVYFI
ncbi:MAG: radical SAM protein [Clostridiales bacterium]|nr:radical SAM protein [Clostridiales bacterium]